MSASPHPNSWPALGALAGGDPRKRSIAWNLATLLLEPCGSAEDYASTVQQHCDAERALVRLGAPEGGDVVAWARAVLARDTRNDAPILALRAEWAGLPAYVAICNLALDGTQPTAEEWAAIEQDDRIGLYEGATQEMALKWIDDTLAIRERLDERDDLGAW